ncbi:hypothetical protein PWT90_10210 [Aphanocladium album]|nr:hypothetical protein PWT90_10210 [Aphanocladium album]
MRLCVAEQSSVWLWGPQSLTYKNYLVETEKHIQEVARAQGVLVVGGGAVGIEMAAELKLTNPHVKVTLAHSRDKLLSSEGLSDECSRDVSLELLKDSGVEVLLNHRLESHTPIESADGMKRYRAKFTNDATIDANVVIEGVSQSVPATEFLPAEARDGDGRVKIQPNLMLPADIPNAEFHYCAGDATKWSGIKRCGGAMRAGHLVAAMNIHQHVLQSLIGHSPKLLRLAHMERTQERMLCRSSLAQIFIWLDVGNGWGLKCADITINIRNLWNMVPPLIDTVAHEP